MTLPLQHVNLSGDMTHSSTTHSHAEERIPQRIGIVGAGFSGTALAAELHRLSKQPLEIFLLDKTGYFGTGAAYSTPYVSFTQCARKRHERL